MRLDTHAPEHFGWELRDGTALVTLTGADRKNPLTFESYAELRDTFRALASAQDVDAVVIPGRGATSARAGTCTTSSAL